MARLWIDCEFNSYQGALISLALVSETGREFYAAVPCADPHPWVAEHVIPVLHTTAVPLRMLQDKLEHWLRVYDAIHVIADWPEDISHFCETLITGPGMRIATPLLTMEVRRDLHGGKSLIPHNALEDAKAIRDMDLGRT